MNKHLKNAGVAVASVIGGVALVALKLVSSLTTVNMLATAGLAIAKAVVKNDLQAKQADTAQTYVEYVVSDLKDKKADGIISTEEFEVAKEEAESMAWPEVETRIAESDYKPAKDKLDNVYSTQTSLENIELSFDVFHWTMVAGLGLVVVSATANAIAKAKE